MTILVTKNVTAPVINKILKTVLKFVIKVSIHLKQKEVPENQGTSFINAKDS